MRRHDLAYLAPGVSPKVLGQALSVPLRFALADWVARHQPLVVARQPRDCGEVLLGLTLPAHGTGQRCACLVRHQDIQGLTPPLPIGRCLGRLPRAMTHTLEQLETRLTREGITAGVYGSLSWETLSGQIYRHPRSDIDLVCDVVSAEHYFMSLEALTDAARRLPCALDGEIRFPDQRAVSWKELAAAQSRHPATQVLVKGVSDIALAPLSALLAQFSDRSSGRGNSRFTP